MNLLEPSTFRADLHCHTTCSDGTFSPEEIILHASQIGLQGLSITDHDTIEAYTIALPIAKKHNILLGTGVEFSCDYHGQSVHVLGYDFPSNSSKIHDFCLRHKQRRRDRNLAILEKLKWRGFNLTLEELSASGTVGRPHIAEAMVKHGYVATVKEAFYRFLAEGQSCYAKGEPFSVVETIEILHQARGKAFLAHPHLAPHPKLVKKLLQLPFDGIECYYAKCSPSEEKRWVNLAEDRKLLCSGGSDFHGAMKPHIPLGCSWVNYTAFSQIFSRTGIS